MQKYKRQLQRSEQAVQKLEDELTQVKTVKRRQSDVIQKEDFKEEIDRYVYVCEVEGGEEGEEGERKIGGRE